MAGWKRLSRIYSGGAEVASLLLGRLVGHLRVPPSVSRSDPGYEQVGPTQFADLVRQPAIPTGNLNDCCTLKYALLCGKPKFYVASRAHIIEQDYRTLEHLLVATLMGISL